MPDEPIRVSSETWTGVTPGEDAASAPVEPGKPGDRPKPSFVKVLLAAIAMTLIFGTQVWSAIAKHEVHRRPNLISGVRNVREAEHPILFTVNASLAFVMMLASIAIAVVILADFWRVKVRKRRSWFGTADKAKAPADLPPMELTSPPDPR